jgi:hypothetical protein
MKTIDEVVDVMKRMTEDLWEEVKDFARYLDDTRARKPKGKMKLKWRGALRDMRDQYTSVELQHKLLESWGD